MLLFLNAMFFFLLFRSYEIIIIKRMHTKVEWTNVRIRLSFFLADEKRGENVCVSIIIFLHLHEMIPHKLSQQIIYTIFGNGECDAIVSLWTL